MSLTVRRVVTGHDENGRAIVSIDETSKNVSFGPGVTPRNHRTDTIDYATVISGEIDMELDGTSVHSRLATCWCSGARSITG
jgi:hypothetical protein